MEDQGVGIYNMNKTKRGRNELENSREIETMSLALAEAVNCLQWEAMEIRVKR